MAGFLQGPSAPSNRTAADDEVPEALAQALNGRAEDLREGRVVAFDSFIDEMEAELEAHLRSLPTSHRRRQRRPTVS